MEEVGSPGSEGSDGLGLEPVGTAEESGIGCPQGGSAVDIPDGLPVRLICVGPLAVTEPVIDDDEL